MTGPDDTDPAVRARGATEFFGPRCSRSAGLRLRPLGHGLGGWTHRRDGEPHRRDRLPVRARGDRPGGHMRRDRVRQQHSSREFVHDDRAEDQLPVVGSCGRACDVSLHAGSSRSPDARVGCHGHQRDHGANHGVVSVHADGAAAEMIRMSGRGMGCRGPRCLASAVPLHQQPSLGRSRRFGFTPDRVLDAARAQLRVCAPDWIDSVVSGRDHRGSAAGPPRGRGSEMT